MSWVILNEEIARFQAKQLLKALVAVVENHPEWQEEEPQLQYLLEAARKTA